MLLDGQTILFQGDSITDAGRMQDPENLGFGYVRMVAKAIAALHPDKQLTILNRGISGNRVPDLEARWDADCIALQPDILFILIGINDTWRRFDSNDPTTREKFEETYRRILTRVVNETKAKVVLMEPFLLPVTPQQNTWLMDDLAGKQSAVRLLAREFAVPLIPLDGIFAALSAQRPMTDFAADGVHPTHEGARVIAGEILKQLAVL